VFKANCGEVVGQVNGRSRSRISRRFLLHQHKDSGAECYRWQTPAADTVTPFKQASEFGIHAKRRQKVIGCFA